MTAEVFEALSERFSRHGFILREWGGFYLLTDMDGLPVHPGSDEGRNPYTLTEVDVLEWAADLCSESEG
ncbi:hypothetical protein [Paracoccus ravus]|uniref:hypothetical protein n=1 Tax=Paracoccus ravus TaxID=2447760 RepID=UPI00106E97A4|nr:hypothetical protein [Paracoccus ravus]